MHEFTLSRIATLCLILLALGCDPIVMIPGGTLSGDLQPHPDDWSFTDSVETVQLETRPDDPYSVNIWGIGLDDEFFVVAGDPESQWAANIAVDPRVRLRVGSDLFELRAERDESAESRARFLAAAQQKYDGFEPDSEQSAKAILYRLVAR